VLWLAGAHYYDAYRFEHQDPPQPELGHGYRLRYYLAQPLDGSKTKFEVHAGKGLPYIEHLTMPVEETVVVL
jgi:hypothetical protein